MFEKLFKPRPVTYLDAVEPKESEVDTETTQRPVHKSSEPRYRVEISAQYDRQLQGRMNPYRAAWKVYDNGLDSSVRPQRIHEGTCTGENEADAMKNAEWQAREWVRVQNELDRGPTKKTVFIDG